MNNDDGARPAYLQARVFAIICGAVSVVLVVVGWGLYRLADRPASDFYGKLGELALQLALIVVVGVIVKEVVEWRSARREHYLKKIENREEFLRRLRAVHVNIQHARDLLNAHRSARTYGEQVRALMQLRPEVEEISEDLKASTDLFADQQEIIEGLEGIVAYLMLGANEYVHSHVHVDADWKAGHRLEHTLRESGMEWTRDLMAGEGSYREQFLANLTRSKGSMRKQVYRGDSA